MIKHIVQTCSCALAATVFATCAWGEDVALGSVADGVYVVTVTEGDVKTLSAADAAAMGDATALAKRGKGRLNSNEAIANFGGEIRIEEGVFAVSKNGHLGVATGTSTVVSNGASLVILKGADALSDGENNGDLFKRNGEHFYLSGHGTEEYPGAVYTKGNGGSALPYATLNGDTTIYSENARINMPMGGGGGVTGGTLDMNGHRLFVKGNKANVYAVCSHVVNPGHIDVVNGTFGIEGNAGDVSWEGDASNTLTVRKGSLLLFAGSKSTIGWSLIVEDGSSVQHSSYQILMTDAFNKWLGPIELGTTVQTVKNPDTICQWLGNISGTGGISALSGKLVLGGTNTYSGVTKLDGTEKDASYGSSITLLRPEAYPADNENGIELTHADLVLKGANETPYDIADVSFAGAAMLTNTAHGVLSHVLTNAADVVRNLTKTGDGILDVTACGIYSNVTVKGGTLRLKDLDDLKIYGKAGLLVGHLDVSSDYTKINETVTYDEYFTDGTGPWTTKVYWKNAEGNNTPKTYSAKGYVWNRSSDEVKWDLAFKCQSRTWVYVNGKPVFFSAMQGNNTTGHRVATVTLKPGANEILIQTKNSNDIALHDEGMCAFRYDRNFSSGGNYNTGNYSTVVVDTYSGSDEEFAYNKTSYYVAESVYKNTNIFAEFVDQGDGYLFTVDNRTPEEFKVSEDAQRYFPQIVNASFDMGTTLDLNGGRYVFETLTGSPVIVNGHSLTVTKAWTLKAEDLNDGAVMDVQVPFALGDGVSLAVDDVSALVHAKKEYTLCRMNEAMTELPDFAEELRKAGWGLSLADGDRTLKLRSARGMTIIIR